MNKSIVMTLLAFVLVIGLSVPTVFAADQTNQPKSGQRTEKEWYQALKTQAALAKAKVSLLRAQSELWLNENKETAEIVKGED